jgi:N-glycosylase/DNA lyase
MVYCLLTPQSSARNAVRAVERLRQEHPWQDATTIARILGDRGAYIRFHNTKARYLIRAQGDFPRVFVRLTDGLHSAELRRWLVRNVRGLGWKEASHFLRNIGHRNLAILDRHILKNLVRHRVIQSLPLCLTPARYLEIECRFGVFARAMGVTLDELDLLFWSRETGEILK